MKLIYAKTTDLIFSIPSYNSTPKSNPFLLLQNQTNLHKLNYKKIQERNNNTQLTKKTSKVLFLFYFF